MNTGQVLETLSIVVLFCLIFLWGSSIYILKGLGQRNAVSVAGGAAVAYVFIQLLPELEHAAALFRQTTAHLELPFLEFVVHVATMLGFVVFYGLEEMVMVSRSAEARSANEATREAPPVFSVHLAAFAAYAWLVSYLLVRSLEDLKFPLALYALAMSLHFLSVAHALRREYGGVYDRVGARILAACCLLGWLSGVLVDMPKPMVVILLGLVACGVIANTTISELPREKEGKFFPFAWGAVAYTGLLLFAR